MLPKHQICYSDIPAQSYANMSGTAESVTNLPPVKRYIATNDGNGKSVYLDSPAQQYYQVPGVGGLARSYSLALERVKQPIQS